MDTKWRNSTRFLLYALLLVIGLSGPLTLWDQGSRYLNRDYYHTQEFHQQLDQFAAYLNLFELNSPAVQTAKNSITVEMEDIVNYRNELAPLAEQTNVILDEYKPLIAKASADGNSNVVAFYIAQRQSKLEELLRLYKDDDYVISLIRKEKEQRIDTYFRLREAYRFKYNELENQFDYFFSSPTASSVHSSLNVPDRLAQKELHGSGYIYTTDYTIDIANSLQNNIGAHELLDASIVPYQGWIAVPMNSPIQVNSIRYTWEQLILFAYCLAGMTLLVLCLKRFKVIMATRSETSLWTTFYRKLPLDAKVLFFAGTSALSVSLLVNLADHYPSILEAPLSYFGRLLVALSIAAIGMALSLLQGQLIVDQLGSWSDFRRQCSKSLLNRGNLRVKARFNRIKNSVKDSFIYKSTGIRLLVLAFILIGLGFIGVWGVVASFFHEPGYNELSFIALFVPILAVIGIIAILLTARQSMHLNRVALAADELAAGRMPNELPPSGSGVLASLAANINELRRGVRLLQNEQAKSERLKTELITNVSHDLRTPLTSIITYTGLLKSEDSTKEERSAYVEIIDQKSKRLKVMIDDLFEVSTMASGNAKLLLEQTDLVQLMQQALAEYKEDMDSSDIQFRISLPEEPISVIADGQKLWRAFDNLIGNMMKYSLVQTRAYITMQFSEQQQEVTITFKNVSKFEISDNAEELFERFKRGDTSRHTEGSGLGLAIAKSIIDLHEGRLTLETDGDLFKATVVLRVGDR
ncbi:sensor histidine kinase [Paenibacillus sp. YAF4_2]|uniref:sensor histidine kinase n=1 Tax=Paenibacillus sp. YAF4_2 TaxID=3233085 RepID=UPI003F944470